MTLVYSGPMKLRRVQLIRRIILQGFTVCAILVLPFVCAIWLHEYPLFHAQIEHVGIFLIFFAIFGRTWCALHISGSKNARIVDTGPYSLVRNPLYVFSLVGTAGVGAQTSSLVVAAVFTVVIAIVFAVVVRKEEAYLCAKFGPVYEEYRQRVPRFFPSFAAYKDVSRLTIDLRLVRRTFIESCYFLVAIPAFDTLELARDYGWIPHILHLP